MSASRMIFFALGIGVGVLLTAAVMASLAAPAELPCDAERCAEVCEELARAGQLGGATLLPVGTTEEPDEPAWDEAPQCDPETGFCAYDPAGAVKE